VVEGVGEMKDHYFQYALITLVAILMVMLTGAVVFIAELKVQNEVLEQKNQELQETIDEGIDEIEILSDRIEEIMSDVGDSEDWNEENLRR